MVHKFCAVVAQLLLLVAKVTKLPFGILHFLLYQLFLPDRHCGQPSFFVFFGLSLDGLLFALFGCLLGHHLAFPLGDFRPVGIMWRDLQRFSISPCLSSSAKPRKIDLMLFQTHLTILSKPLSNHYYTFSRKFSIVNWARNRLYCSRSCSSCNSCCLVFNLEMPPTLWESFNSAMRSFLAALKPVPELVIGLPPPPDGKPLENYTVYIWFHQAKKH